MEFGWICCAKLDGIKAVAASNTPRNSTEPGLEDRERRDSEFTGTVSSSLSHIHEIQR
jgi:hypothetical protein